MLDAIHKLGDSLSLKIFWYFQKIAAEKAADKYLQGF
jgi:hypothetical protein